MSSDTVLMKSAFIDPIKSVVVIDDEFPTYSNMLRGKYNKSKEPASYTLARKLYDQFTKEGKLCVVANPSFIKRKPPHRIPKSIGTTDLLVLDYQLDQSAPGDCSAAHDILRGFAKIQTFNLVVVYTNANESNIVAKEIFLALRKQPTSPINEHVIDLIAKIEETNPRFIGDLNEKITTNQITSYINSMELDNVLHRPLIDYVLELTLEVIDKKYAKPCVAYCLFKRAGLEDCAGSLEDLKLSVTPVPYVAGPTIFVCVLSKKDVVPSEVLPSLTKALCSWQVNPVDLSLHCLLAESRNEVAARVAAVVADRDLVDGWLYQAKQGPNAVEDLLRATGEGLMKTLRAKLHEKRYDSLVARTTSAENKIPNDRRHSVFFALNSFLCTYPEIQAHHLTTGLILKDVAEPDSYWVVLMNSCDLEPGQESLKWKAQSTDSWQPFTALKLVSGLSTKSSLIKATECRFVFIKDGEAPIALAFSSGDIANPHYEIFFAKNHGKFNRSKCVRVKRFVAKRDTKPGLKSQTFEIIAQMRYEYASRFLNMLSAHKARIGVGYIAMPVGE
jgi:hypothetical protein